MSDLKFDVLPEVRDVDLQSINDYYESFGSTLPELFLYKLENTLAHIRANPQLNRTVFGEYRRAYLFQTNYFLAYHTNSSRTIVLALLSGLRDPNYNESVIQHRSNQA